MHSSYLMVAPAEEFPMLRGDSVTFWLDGLKAGDDDPIQRLWDRYFQRLVRLAGTRLPGHARRAIDEEDVALSAFIAFVTAPARASSRNWPTATISGGCSSPSRFARRSAWYGIKPAKNGEAVMFWASRHLVMMNRRRPQAWPGSSAGSPRPPTQRSLPTSSTCSSPAWMT